MKFLIIIFLSVTLFSCQKKEENIVPVNEEALRKHQEMQERLKIVRENTNNENSDEEENIYIPEIKENKHQSDSVNNFMLNHFINWIERSISGDFIIQKNFYLDRNNKNPIVMELSEDDLDFYNDYVGYYIKSEKANIDYIYANYYAIEFSSEEWGSGYYTGPQGVYQIYYDEKPNPGFYYNYILYRNKITDKTNLDNEFVNTRIRVVGPGITDSIFYDAESQKNNRNNEYWDTVTHDIKHLIQIEEPLIGIIEAIYYADFDNFSKYISQNHGILLYDIDLLMDKNSKKYKFTDQEFVEETSDENSLITKDFLYLKAMLEYEWFEISNYTFYYNSFFGEDIKEIVNTFGQDSILIEFQNPRTRNYMSLIFILENSEYKLVYFYDSIGFE